MEGGCYALSVGLVARLRSFLPNRFPVLLVDVDNTDSGVWIGEGGEKPTWVDSRGMGLLALLRSADGGGCVRSGVTSAPRRAVTATSAS